MSQKPNAQPVTQTSPDAETTGAPTLGPVVEKPERSMLLWQVLGGVVLAVVAFVGVAVYQNLNSQLRAAQAELNLLTSDIHKDLARLSESHTRMIKKDDHNTRLRNIWDHIKELRGDRHQLSMLQERCAMLTDLYKAGEEERRRLLGEVKQLRESRAGDDERQLLLQEIRALRERIAQLESTDKRPPVVPVHHAEEQEKK